MYPTIKDCMTDVKIEAAQLYQHLADQPGVFLKYAAFHAAMINEVASAKLAFEIGQASADKMIRDSYTAQNKKLTEALVQQEITSDATCIALQKKLNDVQHQLTVSQHCVEALRQRERMLYRLTTNGTSE